jgi:hypothetical protein
MTSRRDFLKLIGLGVIGYEMDLDKLLWVPGSKKIFLPPVGKTFNMSDIVAVELERIIPAMRALFERDDVFYAELHKYQFDPINLSDYEPK